MQIKITTLSPTMKDDKLDDTEDARKHYFEATRNENNNKANQVIPVKTIRPISIELKMRNHKTELHDIRFQFDPLKDTTTGIANELYENEYIVQDDILIVESSMRRLIENPPPERLIKFPVSTSFSNYYLPNESQLIGYAQLKLTD